MGMIFPSSQLDRAGYYLFDRLLWEGCLFGQGITLAEWNKFKYCGVSIIWCCGGDNNTLYFVSCAFHLCYQFLEIIISLHSIHVTNYYNFDNLIIHFHFPSSSLISILVTSSMKKKQIHNIFFSRSYYNIIQDLSKSPRRISTSSNFLRSYSNLIDRTTPQSRRR